MLAADGTELAKLHGQDLEGYTGLAARLRFTSTAGRLVTHAGVSAPEIQENPGFGPEHFCIT